MRAVVVGPEGEPALDDVPEPDGPGSSCVSSRAASVAPTWRSSIGRMQGSSSGTRSSPSSTTGAASRSSTTRRVVSASAAWPGTSRSASASPHPRSGRAASRSASTRGWVDLPQDWPDWRGTMVRRAARLRAAGRNAGPARPCADRRQRVRRPPVRRGARASRERRVRGRRRPRRAGRRRTGPCRRRCSAVGAASTRGSRRSSPGGAVLVFADAGEIPAADVYRRGADRRGDALGRTAVHAGGGRAPPRARGPGARGPAARALRGRAQAPPSGTPSRSSSPPDVFRSAAGPSCSPSSSTPGSPRRSRSRGTTHSRRFRCRARAS